MPDFTLDPDEHEDQSEHHRRPVRLVGTGLAPTAEVPEHGRNKYAAPPCYVSCSACSAMVLTGATATGTTLALDTHMPTYTVQWNPGTPQPLLAQSRAYPVHVCPRKEAR